MTDPNTLQIVLDALRAGCGIKKGLYHDTEKAIVRRRDIQRVLFAILQELPDDMTIGELRDLVEPAGELSQGEPI